MDDAGLRLCWFDIMLLVKSASSIVKRPADSKARFTEGDVTGKSGRDQG